MPSFKHILFFLAGVLFILQSCSLQKRRYFNGYYTGHAHSASHTEKAGPAIKNVKRSIEQKQAQKKEEQKSLVASNEAKPQPAINFKPLKIAAPGDTCDTLVLKNGVEIKVRVIEITTKLVRYKYCDAPNGAIYNQPLTNLAMIRYKNGYKDEFKEMIMPISNGGPNAVSDEEKVMKKANATLTWGILAFPLLIIYLFGIVCAIVAIENAVSLKKWMRREPHLYNAVAERKANIGMGLGIALLSLIILLIVGVVLALAGFFFI